MVIMTLAALICQFETSTLAARLPMGVKTQLVRELCHAYTRDMSSRIRRLIVQSAIVALHRHNLPEYARVARLTL